MLSTGKPQAIGDGELRPRSYRLWFTRERSCFGSQIRSAIWVYKAGFGGLHESAENSRKRERREEGMKEEL
jgi:hypothetical protein